MKIYTLSYYSNITNVVMGNYSTMDKARRALTTEMIVSKETVDDNKVVEGEDGGYYPLLNEEAWYEISCNDLDDESEDEDEYNDEDYDYDWDDDESDEDEGEDEEDEEISTLEAIRELLSDWGVKGF